MRLIIQDDDKAVGEWVATYVKKRILDFNPTPDRPFVLGMRPAWYLYLPQAVVFSLSNLFSIWQVYPQAALR